MGDSFVCLGYSVDYFNVTTTFGAKEYVFVFDVILLCMLCPNIYT
jgi:hypothetical protein